MKILMIIESLRDGGKQRRLVELVRMLSEKKRYQIMILILKNDIHYKEILDMEDVEVMHLSRRFRIDPLILFSFYWKARKFSPHLVHSWGALPSVVTIPYILLSGKPFVNGMIANSRMRIFSKTWFRTVYTFPFSDVIVSNSMVGLKVYKVPQKKGRLIRNGINFDRIKGLAMPHDLRLMYGVKPHEKVVGMVATIDWRKNFPMFVKAALLLLKERNDVTFFVVGDGPDKETIEAMVPAGEKPFFVFTGKIRNVEEVVNLFDVAILASYGEGTSNSLLEYMLLKKPVVATNVSGINEVVVDGVTGYLVPQNDIRLMKSRIDELLNHPQKSISMGLAGREHVARNYSITGMVSQYESVYSEVMKK